MQFDLFDLTQNKILEASGYQEFKERLVASQCDRCALSQSRTHIVVDRGNPNAKVLMIGEAPGENEDREGQAFVGRAGQLLDELMREIGISTNKSTLIANVVKCRPPGNRAPRMEEAKTCLPYLAKQIQLLKPKIIVLLGATALKYLIKEKNSFSMEEEAGKFFTLNEYPDSEWMILFHPAYLLYDPRKKAIMREHLKRFKQKVSELNIL